MTVANTQKFDAAKVEGIRQLHRILNRVQQSTRGFSGIGLVVYSDSNDLPISPLRNSYEEIQLPVIGWDKVELVIRQISNADSVFHDGFHFISMRGTLTHVSHYFAPPIASSSRALDFNVGARQRTAQLGSLLANVVATGVANLSHDVTIYSKGQRVELEGGT